MSEDESAEDIVARVERVDLRLLSLTATLVTDEPGLAEFCRVLFARFLSSPLDAAYRLEIRREPTAGWRVTDTDLDAKVDEVDWLPGVVAARLLEVAGNRVEDCDLFHGAALCRDGNGLILCGESGFGKSTLTLGLLQRGWRFLSDEVAAIDRSSGELLPFPKAIEIRPATARLLGLESSLPVRRRDKGIVDPEVMFPGCLGDRCTVGAVVFVGAPSGSGSGSDELRVVVHRHVKGIRETLAGLPGFRDADWDTSGEHPLLIVRCDRARFPSWRLDELLGRHGGLVVSSSAEVAPPATFDRDPRLGSVSGAVGVQQLLARFRGKRALARRLEAGGGFGELFASMLERSRDTRFYQLEPGHLDATLDLLEGAV